MTTHLVGVSVPRSGHHYLVSLLQATMGDDLFYCDFYTAQSCCRTIPCSRASLAALRYQKNHDFDAALPADLADTRYLIQVRDPVAAALSDRELVGTTYGALADDPDHHLVWLASKVVYLERFWERWCVHAPRYSLHLAYEDLSSRPGESVRRLLDWLGLPAPAAQIERAVAVMKGLQARGDGKPHVARPAAARRHWSPALYGAFAELVSFFRPEPVLPPGMVVEADTLRDLTAICAALRATGEQALDAFEGAIRQCPRNPFLREAHALCLLGAGQHAAAIATLEAVADGVARHAGPNRTLAECRRRAGDLEGAIQAARAAVACGPGLPSHLVFLGSLLAEAGRHAEGSDAARRALGGYVEDPRELLVAAHLLFGAGSWSEGLAALDRAIALGLAPGEWSELRERVVREHGGPTPNSGSES